MRVYLDVETAIDKFAQDDPLIANIRATIKPDGRVKDAEASKSERFLKLMDEAPLEPLLNRIIGITYAFDDGYIKSIVDDDEVRIFDVFFEDYDRETKDKAVTIVTFNGFYFDLPIMRIRMAKLGRYPKESIPLNPSKYDLSHADVRMMLTNWDKMTRGTLEQWALKFGIEVAYDGVAGKDVPQLFYDHEYETINKKGVEDIRVLRRLFLKVQRSYEV